MNLHLNHYYYLLIKNNILLEYEIYTLCFFKYIIPVILLVALSFNACNTDALTDLNQDPTVAAEIDPGYIMAYTQLRISGERYENWRAVLIYQSTMIQHFAALATYWSGDKYLYNGSYSASLWDRAYNNYVKDLVNLLVITDPSIEGQEDLVNLSRIHGPRRNDGDFTFYARINNKVFTGNFCNSFNQ